VINNKTAVTQYSDNTHKLFRQHPKIIQIIPTQYSDNTHKLFR